MQKFNFRNAVFCFLGACTFYHRPPTKPEAHGIDAARDIFGRSRHKEHRDDMGGAGSFLSESRTLYVGGLAGYKYGGIMARTAGDSEARHAHNMCTSAGSRQLIAAGMPPLEVAPHLKSHVTG